MGCCNGSVFLLVICTIQLVAVLERLVLDFLGFLYLSIFTGFVQIIIVIIAIFGLCLYKHKLVLVYFIWSIIYIAWNIFVICLYLKVGALANSSTSILGLGAGSSYWIKCSRDSRCLIDGSLVEVIHAAIQILLSMIGCVSSSFVIYLLREKDDTNPVFQVYKAPSSRRSSISLRMDRDNSLTRPEPWELPGQGRDSIRSNRSARSARSTNLGHSGTRQSKRSNRGSTRSKKSSSSRTGRNSSGKNKNPNSLPWVPTIVPSSGLDSDAPHSPQYPPGHRRQQGHENESYGYSSSSDVPHNEQLHGQKSASPGSPPGPTPSKNKRYRPTNLGPQFNAASDLPPPLEEGPEAYSRDSVAFPAPPPPLSDGPEPYRSTHPQQNGSRAMHNRPTQLVIPPTPTKTALSSSPSSPGSSSISTEKSLTAFNSSHTLENNLDNSYSNKDYHRPPFPVAGNNNARPDRGNSMQQPDSLTNHQHTPSQHMLKQPSAGPSQRNEGLSNPIYNSQGFSNAQRPVTDMYRPSVGAPKPDQPIHHPDARRSTFEVRTPAVDMRKLNGDGQSPGVDRHQPSTHTSGPPLSLPSKPPYRHSEREASSDQTDQLDSSFDSQASPTNELRQIRSRDTQPKDNTFRRLVTGNLSLSTKEHASPDPRPPPSSSIAMQPMLPAQSRHLQPVSPSNPPQQTHRHHLETNLDSHVPPQSHNSKSSKHSFSNLPSQRKHDQPASQLHETNLDSRPTAQLPDSRGSGHTFISSPYQRQHEQSQHAGDYSSTNVPPWQRPAPAEPPRNSSNSQHSVVPPQTSSASSNPMTGTLKEVTSSYGGLYSSRQSPAPQRRRGNYRSNFDQSFPSINHDMYQSTNITDDVKTTKGPFISSRPSVI